jgi:GntR family transcriptional regulator, transcriptional repressor for pyruvate dehydrogenase complex
MSLRVAGLPEEDQLRAFKPVRVRSVADDVLAVLVDAIRGGHYGVGDRFPKERELAAQLGVSRVVLREAFSALRQAGIVSTQRGHGGGSVVTSLRNLPRVLSHIHGGVRFELLSLLEVRRANEPAAALLTVQRASDRELEDLGELVDALDDLVGDDQAFYEADVRLHLALGELSQNPLLAAIMRDCFNRLAVVREPFLHAHVDFQRAIENQRTLYEAIRGRDRAHILDVVGAHLAALEQVLLGYALWEEPPA